MPQAVKISDVKKELKKLVKKNKLTKNAYVEQSPGEVVAYVDYLNTEYEKAQKILDSVLDTYFVEGIAGRKIPEITGSTKTLRVKIGQTAPKPIINFRSFKRGDNAPTDVQEAGSTFILDMVLRKNRRYYSVNDIYNDKEVMKVLKNKYFVNHQSAINDWIYTYYQQQKKFLEEYASPSWDKFQYGDKDFVKFFSGYITDKKLGIYSDFEKGERVAKYTEWNPSDIYAVKNMSLVKSKLDKIFRVSSKENRGAHLGELNAYLIELIDKKKLVGISLKQIKDNMRAILEIRNTKTTFKDPHIEDENFTINDIKFQPDNIHIKQTVTTYVKFGVKFSINISSSSSDYGNLSYMTSITGASAQGGNAPVAFVNDLIREKGSGYTFINDNKQYPRTNEEFLDPSLRSAIKYDEKDYEKWFKFVKKFFKKPDNNSKSYDQFHEYISGLYQQKLSTGGPPCAQTKLMTLHFFYDTLRTYSRDADFWLRMLYLGMKVGKRFAAHAKIYESGDKEE